MPTLARFMLVSPRLYGAPEAQTQVPKGTDRKDTGLGKAVQKSTVIESADVQLLDVLTANLDFAFVLPRRR